MCVCLCFYCIIINMAAALVRDMLFSVSLLFYSRCGHLGDPPYLGFMPAVDLCLPVEQEMGSLHSYEAHTEPVGDVPPISVQGRLREHSAFWL